MKQFNDKFYPADLKTLLQLFLSGLKKGEILGLPKELIFRPQETDFFKTLYLNKPLDSPIGVAAGPHTQLAQNIVIAWLAGARFIELKTVQTLDELDIPRPCIDMQDEGYNVEWSQELKIKQSFDEYLKAWILIHILANELGLKQTGAIFNMSVGYDFQGIMKPNVQWFLDKMTNASEELEQKLHEIKDIYPKIEQIHIPAQLTDNITLSTMHGCPPDEVEQIASYLLTERKLHTIIKLNPTLLGKEKVRQILKNLGYTTEVPDIAFEHDLKYEQAKGIVQRLLKKARELNLFFGIKLTNTLESTNNKNVFDDSNEMMYMSGRALHPISINLANRFREDFGEELQISFSAGVDAFNIADVLSCGLKPVTVSSDLLKPGGYGRLAQYYENLRNENQRIKARNLEEFIIGKNGNKSNAFEAARENLQNYADYVLNSGKYDRGHFRFPSIKTARPLGLYDCIFAPCQETCPTNQNVPQYMYLVRNNRLSEAFYTVMQDNPFPTITGYACDHTCQLKCTRINYDEALHIREIKRFIAEFAAKDYRPDFLPVPNKASVGIIGGGAAGLSAAFYLRLHGFDVTIYEKTNELGGMVKKALPKFRISDQAVKTDIQRILDLGIKVEYNYEVDQEKFWYLQTVHKYLFVATGSLNFINLAIENSDARGIIDPLSFFYRTRKEPQKIKVGKKVAVIGGGNTAIDAARLAKRLNPDAEVYILYRRMIKDMPAFDHEILEAIEEDIKIMELVSPVKFIKDETGALKGIILTKNRPKGKLKATEKTDIEPIPGSEFVFEVDTVIPTIGQKPDMDIIPEELRTENHIPFTRDEKIYIGVDAPRGGKSIIVAVADGKKVAFDIIEQENPGFKPKKFTVKKQIDHKELKLFKYKRIPAVKPQETQTTDFNIKIKTYSAEQAIAEASRCQLCDEYCSVCTTVCPNMANQTYEIEPQKLPVFKIMKLNGTSSVIIDKYVEIKQRFQTYNIADWCNECGNCATFCPTAGKPYTDKPKIHLTQKSFDESPWGFLFQNNELIYKDKNQNFHHLTISNNIARFYNQWVDFKFDIRTYEPLSVLLHTDEITTSELPDMFMAMKIFEQLLNF